MPLTKFLTIASVMLALTSADKGFNLKVDRVWMKHAYGGDFDHQRILNGNYNNDWNHANTSCIETSDKLGHFAHFVLEHEAKVNRVDLLVRSDDVPSYIDGHEVWVGEHKCGSLWYKNAYKYWLKVYCPEHAIGSSVRVRMPNHPAKAASGKFLQLCGIKVWGF